ncbi:deoxyribose-phosphate aldolase [Colletotrichum salicis]|uniref:Deoxyribose-phosphate aldolase n=1 Tax=Colletotrichum salicis TaxID=1209931 RepID=A0A135U8P8_9PEZI|nr:deoxyribose-phosphate aldolase [Colletotrichum salicis]
MADPTPITVTVTVQQVAKMIDHSLLHPTMTDADILEGLRIAKKHDVATACVKPYLIPLANKELQGSNVLVCPVIGFPHGNSTAEVKVFEANQAAAAGGREIDMIVNIGKVLGGDWIYVAEEIRQINIVVVKHGAILKVILRNDYLEEKHIIRLCPRFKSKATGGVPTLDDLLHVMSLGVTRIGASATVAIMEAAVARGITDQPTEVEFKPISGPSTGGY